jgi:hypothetical protein
VCGIPFPKISNVFQIEAFAKPVPVTAQQDCSLYTNTEYPAVFSGLLLLLDNL